MNKETKERKCYLCGKHLLANKIYPSKHGLSFCSQECVNKFIEEEKLRHIKVKNEK